MRGLALRFPSRARQAQARKSWRACPAREVASAQLPHSSAGSEGMGAGPSKALMMQTNCKHFYSFLGPYINSCGARGWAPAPDRPRS